MGIYLELKIVSVNSSESKTTVKYDFYTGEFAGFGHTEFIRSSVEHYQKDFEGGLSVEKVFKKLLPVLHKEAKEKGYETFQ